MNQPLFAHNRRGFLNRSGLSLGLAGLGTLLHQSQSNGDSALKAHAGHFAPRAKSVIYLHMIGAPSQLDLFEPKPELNKRDNEVCPDSLLDGVSLRSLEAKCGCQGRASSSANMDKVVTTFGELTPFSKGGGRIVFREKSSYRRDQSCARPDLFAFGFGRGGRPSFGSWVTYGLGSENEDLPAYVVLLSGPPGGAGSSLYSSGFLPSVHQGVQFRSEGDSVLYLSNPKGIHRKVADVFWILLVR